MYNTTSAPYRHMVRHNMTHLWLYNRGMHITHLRGIHVALSLTTIKKFFQDFEIVKTKAYRIRHYLYVRPHRPLLQAEASAWRQNKCMEFSLEKQRIGEKIDVTSEWLKHHLPRAYFPGDQERTMLVTRNGRSCLEESTILVGGYYYAGRRILLRWSVPLR